MGREADYSVDCVAERVGFEPTVPCEDNGFRDRPNRPLSHLSDRNILGWNWLGLTKLLKKLL